MDREGLNLKLPRCRGVASGEWDGGGEGKCLKLPARPSTVEVQSRWRSCCGLFRGRPWAPAAAANGLPQHAPGDVSAKRGPYGAPSGAVPARPAPERPPKDRPRTGQEQAKTYMPSTCQMPSRAPARLYKTRQPAGVAACCGMR